MIRLNPFSHCLPVDVVERSIMKIKENIKNNGEVILLLGVRKAESTYRANNIRSREIEGKLLVPHNDIENAYVYNPLTEIPNEDVWKFLLKGDAISPWGSDNKYLFSLYQGEKMTLNPPLLITYLQYLYKKNHFITRINYKNAKIKPAFLINSDL